ncbi:ribosome-associated translation inhibitor RaiA [Patescibacteria group bacterium]|nr:ribosome-associated translation inhibitor RaiA [Patescibacteria group bacterium]
MNVMIKGTNITLSPEMKNLIIEKISSVEKFYPNILEARVEIEFDEHKKKGNNYRCEVNLPIPGKLIRVEKTTPDFEKSVNKVKDHLKVVLSKERNKELKKR